MSTPQNVLCNGGSTGSALATPSIGTPPYTYTWSDGTTNSYPNSSSISNLAANTYSSHYARL